MELDPGQNVASIGFLAPALRTAMRRRNDAARYASVDENYVNVVRGFMYTYA